ncbi:MAG TPA: FHA domain-containing protein [Pyrinomonadaceae bacterium]|nr:FHA domain-containing protein [Pyrinomonadaceae bacterium]
MTHSFIALALQDAADSSIWIIIGVVLLLLFLFVLVVVVGLVIFFVMRKRKKAQQAAALVPEVSSRAVADAPLPSYSQAQAPAVSEAAVAVDLPPPTPEAPPFEEIRSDVAEASITPAVDSGSLDFDPSRTVAITRENTVAIDYGRIKFVSGVLAGQEFDVQPEGSYIGRESSLAQIVVPDPRISKRHLWIGVKDALVKIVDQDSRNGTFINDPRSERVTEAVLSNGDTVILGESDVARFEYEV